MPEVEGAHEEKPPVSLLVPWAHPSPSALALICKWAYVKVTCSLRSKISVVFASREITLTKYIVKNINIYST